MGICGLSGLSLLFRKVRKCLDISQSENLSLEENDNLQPHLLRCKSWLRLHAMSFRENTVYHPSSTQQLQSVGSWHFPRIRPMGGM